MHALAAAREAAVLERARARPRRAQRRAALRVYCSEQAHSSIDKAVHRDRPRPRVAAQDSGGRRVPDARRTRWRDAIAEDRAAGRLPIAVVATVGTTSTTSVDPVAAIADICAARRAVAARGRRVRAASRRCCRRTRTSSTAPTAPIRSSSTRTSGCSRPFDLSAFYCRRMDVVRAAFALTPEYICARRRRRAAPQPDGHRRPARPPVPRAEAVDDPALVRRASDSRAAVANTSASRSCSPRGWTRIPISSGWRRCRSASSASAGIPRPPLADEELDAANERLLDASTQPARCSCRTRSCAGASRCASRSATSRPSERHVRRAWELLKAQLPR